MAKKTRDRVPAPIFARFKEIFRSAFLQVTGVKRRLLQFGVVLLGAGLIGGGYSLFSGPSEGVAPGAEVSWFDGWSWASLSAGAGCLLGFFVGAAIRVFLKLALLLGLVIAGVVFGISYLGWIDVPFDSFADANRWVADGIGSAFTSMHDFLSGYLPSSVMSGLGFASGVTQKPDTDPDD